MVEIFVLQTRGTAPAGFAVGCRRLAMEILGESAGKHELPDAGWTVEKYGVGYPAVGHHVAQLALDVFV